MAGKKKLTFEEAYEKLEAVVGKLQQGQATLEESIKLYEEGTQLAQHCSQLLSEMKGKVQVLMPKEAEGEVEPQPFQTEEDV